MIELPNPLEFEPDLGPQRERYERLGSEVAALRVEIDELERALSRATTDPLPDPARARVLELVTGGGAAPSLATATAAAAAAARVRLNAARSELRDREEALRMLARSIAELTSRASIRICELLAPVHHQRVRRMITALLEVHEAQLGYAAFQDAFDQAGLSRAFLRGMAVTALGNPHDPHSRLGYYFKEAVAEGFMSLDEVPLGLRQDVARDPDRRRRNV